MPKKKLLLIDMVLVILILVFTLVSNITSFSLIDSDNKDAQKLGISLPKRNIPAKDITFENLDGEMVKLSDYKGKVILLNIWASWCPPCRMEMPSMEGLYKELGQDGFEIIALSIEHNIKREKLIEYADKGGYTFTIGIDRFNESVNDYYKGSTPISYVIGKDFSIKGRLVGTTDWNSKSAVSFISDLIKHGNNNEG